MMARALLFLCATAALCQAITAQSGGSTVLAVPITVNDSIAITGSSIRQRDDILLQQVKPQWSKVIGNLVSDLYLATQSSTPWTPATSPDGTPIFLVQYVVTGIANGSLSLELAKAAVHRELIAANLPNVYAVPDANGQLIPIARSVSTATSILGTVVNSAANATGTTIMATSRPASLAAVPQAVAASVPQLVPVFQSDLYLANYTNNDRNLIIEGLRGLWAGALGTTVQNVKILMLDSSGQGNSSSSSGVPLFDFKYQLLTNQPIPDIDGAWSRFNKKVADAGLKELLKSLPSKAPVSLLTTTTAASTTIAASAPASSKIGVEEDTDENTVIPLLTFMDNLDVAIGSAEDVVALSDGLKILWANASGTNASTVGIRVAKLVNAKPRRSVHGVPVQTVSYEINLHNVSHLSAVSARTLPAAQRALLGKFFIPEGSEVMDTTTMATTTTILATTSITTTPVPPPPCLNHTIDVRIRNIEIGVLLKNLTAVWASAYGLPQENIKITLMNSETINASPTNRRLHYCVQVFGGKESSDIVLIFERFLPISPIKPYLIVAFSGDTLKTNHTLQVLVQNATEMDIVLVAMRSAWTTALDMADLPQIPIVTITRFHNDNFMDQSSCLPVTTLMYDLTVPSNIEVRQEHDAVVHGLLEASSAGPYIYKAAPKKTGPAPFSISDTIVLSAGNKRQRDAILQSVVRLWGQAIGQGSKDIKIQVNRDEPYLGSSPSNATNLRRIEYSLSGVADQPVDEYAAKLVVRAVPAVDGVALFPEPTRPVLSCGGAIRNVAASLTISTFGSSGEGCSKSSTQFLWLPRAVAEADKADMARLIASAWAGVNYWADNDLQVDISSLTSDVDRGGSVDSSVVYTVSGPTCDLVVPSNALSTPVSAKTGGIGHTTPTQMRIIFWSDFHQAEARLSSKHDTVAAQMKHLADSKAYFTRSFAKQILHQTWTKGKDVVWRLSCQASKVRLKPNERQFFSYVDVFLLNFREGNERDGLLRRILAEFKNTNSDISFNRLNVNLAKLTPMPEYGELMKSANVVIRGQSSPALDVEDARSRMRTVIQQGRIPNVEWGPSWVSIEDDLTDMNYAAPDEQYSNDSSANFGATSSDALFENWQPFTYSGVAFSNETRPRTLAFALEKFRHSRADRRFRSLKIYLGCPMADSHKIKFDVTGYSDPPIESGSAGEGSEFFSAASHTDAGERMEFSYVDQLTMAFTNNKERDGLLVSVLDQFRKALPNYSLRNLKIVIRKQLPAPELGPDTNYATVEVRGRSCPALDLEEARQNFRDALQQEKIPNVEWAMSWVGMDDDQATH